jgi:hypothetical protein
LGFARLVKVVSLDTHDNHAGDQLFCLAKGEDTFFDSGYRGNWEEWVNQALHIPHDVILKKGVQIGFQVQAIERIKAFFIFRASCGLPGVLNAPQSPLKPLSMRQ